MPFLGALAFLVAVACCVHAVRTGRPNLWLFLLIATPGIGALIYFLAEILPDLRHNRAAGKVKADVSRMIDPDRDYREAAEELAEVETVATLTQMARQLAERERYGEAAELLERCLAGPHAHDPDTLIRLAEMRFRDGDHQTALKALDDVQEHHPGYKSETGHLLYARAEEALGRDNDALTSYESLATYATGEEPRVRYGLLLRKLGRTDEAHAVFEDVVRRVDRASRVYRKSQREWYQVARSNL